MAIMLRRAQRARCTPRRRQLRCLNGCGRRLALPYPNQPTFRVQRVDQQHDSEQKPGRGTVLARLPLGPCDPVLGWIDCRAFVLGFSDTVRACTVSNGQQEFVDPFCVLVTRRGEAVAVLGGLTVVDGVAEAERFTLLGRHRKFCAQLSLPAAAAQSADGVLAVGLHEPIIGCEPDRWKRESIATSDRICF